MTWRTVKAEFEALHQDIEDELDHHRSELNFEIYVYEMAGARPEDRPQFELHANPHRDAITAAENGVKRRLLAMLQSGERIAVGRRHFDADEEVIPLRYWPFLSLDVDEARASGEGLDFRGIRIIDARKIGVDDPIRNKISAANDKLSLAEKSPSSTSKRVGYAAMAKFLAGHVATMEPGHPGLSENALWAACKDYFAERAPSRKMLRRWIDEDMNPAKRKRRGDRAR